MTYTAFGFEDAPSTYRPGQPAPAGSENAELTADRLEAFGQHVYDAATASLPSSAGRLVVTGPGVTGPEPSSLPQNAVWIEVREAP